MGMSYQIFHVVYGKKFKPKVGLPENASLSTWTEQKEKAALPSMYFHYVHL